MPTDPKAPFVCPPGRAARRHERVAGPFEGRWVAALSVPLRIHDLSAGGCLIEAHHEPSTGSRLTIEIDLPVEGEIQVRAEVVYTRPDYGFAVRFVDVPQELSERLDQVVKHIQASHLTR